MIDECESYQYKTAKTHLSLAPFESIREAFVLGQALLHKFGKQKGAENVEALLSVRPFVEAFHYVSTPVYRLEC